MECSHATYSDGHCAEMPCMNYASRCPRHAPSGSPGERCSREPAFPAFNAFTREEVDSIYVEDDERFVVSFITGYGSADDGVADPRLAAAAALDLTRDEGSDGTRWFVFDRKTKSMHTFEQSDFEDEVVP